jgi:hypothetical protein
MPAPVAGMTFFGGQSNLPEMPYFQQGLPQPGRRKGSA